MEVVWQIGRWEVIVYSRRGCFWFCCWRGSLFWRFWDIKRDGFGWFRGGLLKLWFVFSRRILWCIVYLCSAKESLE